MLSHSMLTEVLWDTAGLSDKYTGNCLWIAQKLVKWNQKHYPCSRGDCVFPTCAPWSPSIEQVALSIILLNSWHLNCFYIVITYNTRWTQSSRSPTVKVILILIPLEGEQQTIGSLPYNTATVGLASASLSLHTCRKPGDWVTLCLFLLTLHL